MSEHTIHLIGGEDDEIAVVSKIPRDCLCSLANVPRMKFIARSLPLFIGLFACTAVGQTNQASSESFRPFQMKVEVISKNTVDAQCRFVVELNRSLMAEDYAIVTRRRDVPHFGHLARELAVQQKFEVMRAILRQRELSPYNYFTIAELLAEKLDAGAFELLLTNSSVNMPPPKGDRGIRNGNDIVSGEGIPEYSALSLLHYLKSEVYQERAEAHLLAILKNHKRSGVRAFAAEALGYSKSRAVIKPLTEAIKDRATVWCVQCGEDYVGQYAEKALKKVKEALTSRWTE